jgi:hypothetical protein
MADHCELAGLRAAAMNISVPPAHRALARPKISPGDIDQRLAKCGTSSLVANEGRKYVAPLQKKPAGDAHRFLAFAQINAPGDQTASIKTRELLLKNARLEHDAERLEIFLVRRCFRSGSATFRGLKHPLILAATVRCGKWDFVSSMLPTSLLSSVVKTSFGVFRSNMD